MMTFPTLENLYEILLERPLLSLSQLHPLKEKFLKLSQELNEKLAQTTTTQEIEYDKEKALLYSLFYMPTNWHKLESLWNTYSPLKQYLLDTDEFWDLGTGPGTYLWAYLFLKKQVASKKIKAFAIDHSLPMLEMAKKLYQGLLVQDLIPSQSESDVIFQLGPTWPKKETSSVNFKTLLLGNSLTEFGAFQTLSFIKKLNPTLIINIMPGTKVAFAMSQKFKQELIKKELFDYSIEYPCFSSLSCPLLKTKDWCHQYVHPQLDQSLMALLNLLKKNRHHLPVIFQIFIHNKAKEQFKKSYDSLDGNQDKQGFLISNDKRVAGVIQRLPPAKKFGHEIKICTFEERQKIGDEALEEKEIEKTIKEVIVDKKAVKKNQLTEGSLIEGELGNKGKKMVVWGRIELPT